MKVLQISKKDTIQLKRNLGKTFTPPAQYEEEENDFHLGGFVDGKLVTTASFHLERNPLIEDENQFRLDEVISTPESRDAHVTKELLKTAFPLMKRNFTNIVWCETKPKYQEILQELDFRPLAEKQSCDQNVLMVKNL